jgi:hypothetical protein
MQTAPRGRARSSSPQARRRLARRLTAAAAAFAIAALPGCFTDDAGLLPPLDQLYFPTNLVVSPGKKALYVTNSDFDLQYSGGTVQLLDLDSLRSAALILQTELDKGVGSGACASLNLTVNAQNILYPGPCGPVEIGPFVKSAATIGAFASSAVFVRRPDELRAPGTADEATARLFVSVRGDPSVTYFDVADDTDPSNITTPTACNGSPFCLSCDATGDEKRCSAEHRVGEDSGDSIRDLILPVEPLGIAASEHTEALVTVHQTENIASLVVNRWGGKPALDYYLVNFPFAVTSRLAAPTDVLAIPEPAFVKADRKAQEEGGVTSYTDPTYSYEPGFVVTFRALAQLHVLRYHSDKGASPPRPFLSRGGAVSIDVNSSGLDSRGGAIDASERKACEATCAGETSCLRACVAVPLRLFVANRSPPSLVIGEIHTTIVTDEASGLPAGEAPVTGVFDDITITDTVPLTFGPSRVAIGHVIDEAGEKRVRVFAVTFDSRLVFVYDPAAGKVEAVVRTGRGPHAVAFDTGGEGDGAYSFMYVGHFTDSYIGVVDLDMRKPQTFGSMFLTVGKPVPPRDSK